MKRTPMPHRKSPLPRGSAVLARVTPLRLVSAKRARDNRQRARMTAVLTELFPLCELCGEHPAEHTHEPLTRARGGSITDPANARRVCPGCHRWIHDHPAEALASGWLRHSWER